MLWWYVQARGVHLVKEVPLTSLNKSDKANQENSQSQRLTYSLLSRIFGIFGGKSLSPAEYEELFEMMIQSDFGVNFASKVLDRIQSEKKEGSTQEEAILLLRDELMKIFEEVPSRHFISLSNITDRPTVVLLVGVNGAGKTTTAAKLGYLYKKEGASVLLVAADTFRAAAVEQLVSWGERLSIPVFTGANGAKPSGVVFDGIAQAIKDKTGIVIIDTAGRLHTKANLMQELGGIKNAITRQIPDARYDILLVLDGTAGQNALIQAREFSAVAQLSGVVITKLDGTSKGGIVGAVADELKIPVVAIGVGEKVDDLRPFNPNEFVEALLS